MRCFSKVSPNDSVAQFSEQQDDLNDSGDSGGAPVFKWFSILEFGQLLFSFHACWINLLSHYDLSSVGYAKDLLTYISSF